MAMKRLADAWATQTAQRDQEMRGLQERAASALTELRRSEGAVQATKTQAMAERAELVAAHNESLDELKQQRGIHDELLARVREEAAEVLAQERRDRAALSLQLNEAIDVVSSRDQTINHLRQSFLDDMERARGPPTQTAVPRSDTAGPLSLSNCAGPMPNSAAAEAAHDVVLLQGGWARAPPLAPSMASMHSRDGSSSVCRISTESTPFAALGSVPLLPPATHGVMHPTRRRSVSEVARIDAAVSSSSFPRSAGSVDVSFNGSSAAGGRLSGSEGFTGTNTVSTAPTAEPAGEFVARPLWELPAKDFLSQWRQSWDSERATTDGPSARSAGAVTVASEPRALRITASFE